MRPSTIAVRYSRPLISRPASAMRIGSYQDTVLLRGSPHLAGPDGPPLEVTHADCGSPVRAGLLCDDDHRLDETGRELVATPTRQGRPERSADSTHAQPSSS